MYVVTAFLNPDFKGKSHIQVPEGVGKPDKIKKGAPPVRILKGLCFLNQGERLWNNASKQRFILTVIVTFVSALGGKVSL